MEEDSGASIWFGGLVGVGCVVTDVELERMRVIVLAHLRFLFPFGARFVVEKDVAVVHGGSGVFYPEVASGDPAVGETSVLLDAFVDTIGSTYLEHARWSAPVTFFFKMGRGGEWVDSASPGETILPESSGDWLSGSFPAAAGAFVECDADVGRIPRFCGADDELVAVFWDFPSCRRQKE